MTRYIGRQLVSLIVLLFFVSVAAFVLVRLLPGDAATAYLNSINAPLTEEAIAEVEKELGLDAPLPVQYGKWLMQVLEGDLGFSYQTRRPVPEELAADLRYTGILALTALGWVLALSLILGVLSARHAGGAVDMVIRAFTFLGSAMPKFWLGFLAVSLFALRWKLLPVQGATTWKHLVLPSLTLACSYIATYTKLLRNSILEVQSSPFVRPARARGLSKGYVMVRHVIPNALTPVFTTLGLHLGGILSGSVIVENVFAWPGLGRMCVDAVAARNYPMIQGYILLLSVIFVTATLLCDLICAAFNPKLRVGGRA